MTINRQVLIVLLLSCPFFVACRSPTRSFERVAEKAPAPSESDLPIVKTGSGRSEDIGSTEPNSGKTVAYIPSDAQTWVPSYARDEPASGLENSIPSEMPGPSVATQSEIPPSAIAEQQTPKLSGLEIPQSSGGVFQDVTADSEFPNVSFPRTKAKTASAQVAKIATPDDEVLRLEDPREENIENKEIVDDENPFPKSMRKTERKTESMQDTESSVDPSPMEAVPLPGQTAGDSVDREPQQDVASATRQEPSDSLDSQLVYSNPTVDDSTIRDELPGQFQDMPLDTVIQIALNDTEVLRSLSANVLRNSPSAMTSYDPSIEISDPNFGAQAALAAFDAVFTTSAGYANNDDFFNNPSTTGNAAEIQQDFTSVQSGLSKVNQYGTQFSFNQLLTHDSNNNPSVFFPSAWEQEFELTARQPLLQGRGRDFNMIAGPNARPGFLGTRGLWIAKSDFQIAQADFERGLREYLLEVINAYWQLDLAYRNYETLEMARDSSFETWQLIKSRFDNSLKGGEADREAQARSQYYQFEQNLHQALNGSGRSESEGVLQAEANLRRLLNMNLGSQPQLIRPNEAVVNAKVIFNWGDLSGTALSTRVELRQQSERIRQASLTAAAAKNFLLPRLDAFTTYRTSGLGDDYINNGGKFAGALNEILDGNYQEWEFGIDYQVPVGRRQARTGVRHALLKLQREKALYTEMQQQVLHDLRSQLRSFEQSKKNIDFAVQRRDAAKDAYLSRLAAFEADAIGFEDLLLAQRDLVQSELDLQIAKTEQQQAIYRLAAESGTLLREFCISVADP